MGSMGAAVGSMEAMMGSMGAIVGLIGAVVGSMGANVGSMGAFVGSMRAVVGSMGAKESHGRLDESGGWLDGSQREPWSARSRVGRQRRIKVKLRASHGAPRTASERRVGEATEEGALFDDYASRVLVATRLTKNMTRLANRSSH